MTKEGFELLKQYENCSLIAYQCPAKVWTIGWGSTFYANGEAVKEGDKVDMATANRLLEITVADFEKQVKLLLNGLYLPEICIDALVCLSYNIGITAFAKSSLLKRIKEDKNNLTLIEQEFKRWVFCKGVKLKGLEKRRQAEYELYEKGILSQYSKSEIFHKCHLK